MRTFLSSYSILQESSLIFIYNDCVTFATPFVSLKATIDSIYNDKSKSSQCSKSHPAPQFQPISITILVAGCKIEFRKSLTVNLHFFHFLSTVLTDSLLIQFKTT
mmetsp:Transcript_36239/g.47793  ORF Transcript_36239/g.47793 Transcript_36239/m.47793 type:complete len:105 (-) Transcript_36239:358-672(-)